MSFFGRHDESTSYGVLIDISSGSIGVAVVKSDSYEPVPKILYSERVIMRVTKHGANETENLRRIKETLFSTSLTLSQDGLKALYNEDPHAKITKLYVTCASPWSYTTSRDIYLEEDSPFKITQDVVEDLIESAESEMLSEISDAQHLKGDIFEIVERATVHYTVNDYSIQNPLKLKAHSFGLTHIGGLVPSEIIESIKEIQDKFFPDSELKVHTYMFTTYCVLRTQFPENKSLCVIDVTAESTEVAIIADGLLTENIFTQTGSSTFIRNASEKTGLPVTDIQSFMDTGTDTTHLDSEKLSEVITQYQEEISKILAELQKKQQIPNLYVLTVQKPYESFYQNMLADCLEKSLISKPKYLDLKTKIQKESNFSDEIDVYLMLLAHFFHKSYKCTSVTAG